MADDTQSLEFALGGTITGLTEGLAYADWLDKVAAKEQLAARRYRASSRALEDLNKQRKEAAENTASAIQTGGTASTGDITHYVTDAAENAVRSGATRLRKVAEEYADAIGATRGGPSARIDSSALGPRENLARATGELSRARARGDNSDRIADLEDRLNKANQSALRADTEKSLGDKVKDAFMTSRVGVSSSGIELMPLVNRLAAITPLAPAFTLITEAAQVAADHLRECAEAARANAREFTGLLSATTANNAEAAKLHVLGSVGEADLGGDADRLKSAVGSGDVNALYWRQKLGISPVPDLPGHAADWGGRALSAIDRLRALRKEGKLTQAEEFQALKSLGMGDAYSLVEMGDEAYKQTLKQSDYYNRIHSPETQQKMIDYRAWANLTKQRNQASDDANGQRTAPFQSWLDEPIPGAGDDPKYRMLSPTDYSNQRQKKQPTSTPTPNPAPTTMGGDVTGGLFDWILKWHPLSPRGKSTNPSHAVGTQSAMDSGAGETPKVAQPQSEVAMGLWALVAELSRNTAAISAHGSIMGGGQRAKDAIPWKLSGPQMAIASVREVERQQSL